MKWSYLSVLLLNLELLNFAADWILLQATIFIDNLAGCFVQFAERDGVLQILQAMILHYLSICVTAEELQASISECGDLKGFFLIALSRSFGYVSLKMLLRFLG